MAFEHFPKDTKPFDLRHRPFHRVGAPHYDSAVDTASGDSDKRPGRKQAPSGLARESGARGPEAFQESGFLGTLMKLLAKLVKGATRNIPGVNFVNLLDFIAEKITGKSPIEELSKFLGNLLGSAVEGALFARYLRSIPAWVPVGRKGYANEFVYREDGEPRTVTREEEREVEGFLVASYPIVNDTVFTQWSHFRHWTFHVQPTAGFRYLVGRGNVPDPNEQKFLNDFKVSEGDEAYRALSCIYGQTLPNNENPVDTGALECLMDLGALTKPPGDRGSHGAMFNAKWPYWPMVGDYFWASGRWAYDCMRAFGEGTNERFPTMINPVKAFASARVEGFKFAQNTLAVPATRFFFFATSEGGYVHFRQATDHNQKVHTSDIHLEDEDYTFLIDLPPVDAKRSDFAVGGTVDFPLNRIVLRPRLLIDIKQGPFGITELSDTPSVSGLTFQKVDPIIEVLRPSDLNAMPTQAKVTIPLKQLGASDKPRAVALDIAFGWHDPDEAQARTLFKVKLQVRRPRFISKGGEVRFVSAVNGRWHLMRDDVSSKSDRKGQLDPQEPLLYERELLLTADAPVSVISNGIWLHGFGEFIESGTSVDRLLSVGPLINVSDDTKKKLRKMLDDTREEIEKIRKLGKDAKDPKGALRRKTEEELAKLKAQGVPQQVIDDFQQRMNTLINGLPDAPSAFQDALKGLDKQLGFIVDGLDAVDDFLKLTDDLIGPKREPSWQDDIDAKPKSGLEESKRVSAIARAMFLRPTPVINKSDEPLGWAEFVDTVRVPLGRGLAGSPTISPTSARVSTLRANEQNLKQSPFRFALRAHKLITVGSGNNLGLQTTPTEKNVDYEFEVNTQITPQVS
jgi:hypothetical protein